MQYVNLGKTGMKVSRLCLGMMSYGSKEWREWILDEEQAKPFIKRALDAGINFFDTADVYSIGESERITGNLLKHLGVKRENVVVATKVNAGFWGIGRKLNYTGELMMYCAWTSLCGLVSWVPYLLPAALAVLFVHRALRDDRRCRAKYGSIWEEYCGIARFRMIPFVY